MRQLSSPLFTSVLLICAFSQSANAQGTRIAMTSSQGYAQRPLTLSKGTMRVDFGPPDFGFMDHGEINGPLRGATRGLSITVRNEGKALVSQGLGLAFGVTDELEVGTMVVPFLYAPNFDFGDMELYGRYAFLKGRYELAAQLTLLIPTQTNFGFGLGVPTLFEIGDSVRVDTGVELEFIFDSDAKVNLDIPAAFSVEIAKIAFIGGRTGAFVVDFHDLDINLGIQGGVTIHEIVDITASFNWPLFVTTRNDNGLDAFNLDYFQIMIGGTLYFDLYKA